jgi:hypothetical protein
MKLTLANKFRGELVAKMMDFLKAEIGDDIGMVNSNTMNFPIVVDEEEGWCEIVVKVTKDDGDDGYAKREEYEMKLAKKKQDEEERKKTKEKKIERDKKLREEKKKKKEEE